MLALFAFFWGWALPAEAQEVSFKTTKACHLIRLSGSIIDVSTCDQTAVDLTQVQCANRNHIKSEKRFAKLSGCTQTKASAQLEVDGEKISFQVQKAPSAGMEFWQVKQLSTPKTEALAAAARVRSASLSSSSGKSVAPSNPSLGMDAFKVGLYADVFYIYNLNGPQVDSSLPDTFASSQTALRYQDRKHNQFQVGLASLGINYDQERWGARLKLDYGSQGAARRASPIGALAEERIEFREMNLTYSLSESIDSRLTLGLFESPMAQENYLSGLNSNFSHSISETVGVPHQHMGVNWARKWRDRFHTDFYLVNGWNVEADNNESLSIGLQAKYVYKEVFLVDLDGYFGPERPESNSGNRMLAQGTVEWSPIQRIRLVARGLIGSSDKERLVGQDIEPLWNGAVGIISYEINPESEAALRFENFNHTDGFLSGEQSADNITSLTGTYKRIFRNSFRAIAEVRVDQSDGDLFLKNSGERARNQTTFLMATYVQF